MPKRSGSNDGDTADYDTDNLEESGCVVCIAGTAYGDGLDEVDYAEYDLSTTCHVYYTI